MRPLLVLLVLLAPTALAHLAFDRPSLQAFENPRLVDFQVNGERVRVSLLQDPDPLRHAVVHDLHGARSILVEHRPDASVRQDAFHLETRFEAMLEYKDFNADTRLTPQSDTIVRTWRFASLPWAASPVQNVTVGGAEGQAVTWTSNLSGAPHFEVTVAAAGHEIVDEGARARPQDVLVYVEAHGFPRRGTGQLHAINGTFVAPAGATLQLVRTGSNETVGVYAEQSGRRGYLLWGGQATIDGREQTLHLEVGEPVRSGANETWPFVLHLPLMDQALRLVLVSALEYHEPRERAPGPGLPLLLGACAVGLLFYGGLGRKSR